MMKQVENIRSNETEGNYTCGGHSIMYKLIKPLTCITEPNVTLCVKYIQIKKINEIKY